MNDSNTLVDINPIPYLTWNWLKINKDSVDYNFSLEENCGNEIQIPENVTVSSGKSIKTALSEPESSLGKNAQNLILQNISSGKIYTIEKSKTSGEEKPLIIRINSDKNSAALHIIHAKSGSRAKIIFVYEGNASDKTQDQSVISGIVTKVYAEEDSDVQISKVQLCKNNVNQMDETCVVCGERAKVSLIQIELGANHINPGFHVTLEGYLSKFVSDTAYLCKGNQYIDMNQVVVHKGQKTSCSMATNGTAKDECTKTYRGTIDLVKGCIGSVGNEIETTLLLSPKAVVKAAPIILCGEENISAEHGSTIGKLSNEMLFYMNSRGIDQKTAENLLTRAKITAAAANIPDQNIQSEIQNFLDGVM